MKAGFLSSLCWTSVCMCYRCLDQSSRITSGLRDESLTTVAGDTSTTQQTKHTKPAGHHYMFQHLQVAVITFVSLLNSQQSKD